MTDLPRRKPTYPMSIEDKDDLARELAEFGYRETSDPDDADRRNYYKVELWDADELHIKALLHASNDLSRAKAIFAAEKKRRPPGRYTLRQGISRAGPLAAGSALTNAKLPELLKRPRISGAS